MRKFLVIQTASIGDVILSTSLLEELHYNFPQEKIDMLVKKGNESLFDEHPFIGEKYIWDKEKKKKYRNLFKLIKKVRKTNYEYVININRFFSSGLITALSNSKIKIGFKKNPLSRFFDQKIEHLISHHSFIHEIERNYQLIANICEDSTADVLPPKLYPNKKAIQRIDSLNITETYYTISPSSLWKTKEFHTKGWIEFLNAAPKDCTIFLLGGKSDDYLCKEIKNGLIDKKCIILAGELSLLASAQLMKNAKMNFTNDSAPLHLCSSVNAPITSIFCSTVPAFGFTPLSRDSKIVQTNKNLSCRPCGLHGYNKCPKKHFLCSKTIDINQLIDRL
ncbi:MAG: glycosyltransferase family 9 protein [Bacteroidales bacterium]|jgi:heptosyltransferase-2|nr:glycosyltransferase family 9 protein [Bacteroidales bacterium]